MVDGPVKCAQRGARRASARSAWECQNVAVKKWLVAGAVVAGIAIAVIAAVVLTRDRSQTTLRDNGVGDAAVQDFRATERQSIAAFNEGLRRQRANQIDELELAAVIERDVLVPWRAMRARVNAARTTARASSCTRPCGTTSTRDRLRGRPTRRHCAAGLGSGRATTLRRLSPEERRGTGRRPGARPAVRGPTRSLGRVRRDPAAAGVTESREVGPARALMKEARVTRPCGSRP